MPQTKPIVIPITRRARTYGYIIWRKKDDEVMGQLLGNNEVLEIEVANTVQKRKHVDRKQRRISLGYRMTQSFDKHHTEYLIECPKPGRLRVWTQQQGYNASYILHKRQMKQLP